MPRVGEDAPGDHHRFRIARGDDQEERERLARTTPLGRLGRWTADHVRVVAIGWVVVALGLGVFAPKVETALSGGFATQTPAPPDQEGSN